MKRIDKEKIFNTELRIINIGAETFYESLREQGTRVIQVDWRPPAGGDPYLVKLLHKLS